MAPDDGGTTAVLVGAVTEPDATTAVVSVPAQDPAPPPGKGPEFGNASPVGLVVVLLLLIATVVLIRSMSRRIRRLPPSFDEPDADGVHGTRGAGGVGDAGGTVNARGADGTANARGGDGTADAGGRANAGGAARAAGEAGDSSSAEPEGSGRG